MNNGLSKKRLAAPTHRHTTASHFLPLRLIVAALLLLGTIAVTPTAVSLAQRSYWLSRLQSVSVQTSGTGVIVSLMADAAVVRPQTWQDSEGFHLVLPNTVARDSLQTARGVKLRRIGNSLEVLVQTRAGAHVSVETEDNQLNLVVDKKLEPRAVEKDFEGGSTVAQQLFQEPAVPISVNVNQAPVKDSSPSDNATSSTVTTSETPHKIVSQPTAPLPATSTPIVPNSDRPAETQPAQDAPVQVEEEGSLASVFSFTSIFVVIVLGLFGVLVTRKLRSRQAIARMEEVLPDEEAEWVEDETSEGTIRPQIGASTALSKTAGAAMTGGPSRPATLRQAVVGPTSLFGAYRIDQEVGKLLLGQPHRMDVLGSRAIDDRRAIETSLMKGMNSPDVDENGRRKARAALEEYGFVARQCATLLLSADAFERSSAARCLGDIKSEAALPFLLESLYDTESTVRNQAVVSIGELKVPSAIGALLDIARTHPDVPSALLSKTLSACSVEGLDFFDAVPLEPAQLGTGLDDAVISQITHLEPASTVEELPATSDDERFAQALVLSESADVQERSEALKSLALFKTQQTVNTLAQVARHDTEPSVRAVATAGLGLIDHESVFPTILLGMADETREVRAAAARALNRLSFDRADAYTRVIETSDAETICAIANACMQTGIVSQNIDRLANTDYPHAYETFSLICLLMKANLGDSILDSIVEHPNLEVRLKLVHLLAATGDPGMFEQLRQLAVRDGVREEVKTALLEEMYKLDQQAKKVSEKAVVEKGEQNAEVSFEPTEPEVATHADVDEGFEFSFNAATDEEAPLEFDANVQQRLDELEM